MGFDLYGLNPKGDIPKPVITDWGDEKQANDFFKYQDETPGSYFSCLLYTSPSPRD